MSNVIPSGTLKQAEEAERMLAEYANGGEVKPEPVVNEPVVEEPAVVAEEVPAVVEESVEETKPRENTFEPDKLSEVEAKLKELTEKFEMETHKKEVAQGRYRKEIEELKEQVSERDRIINSFEASKSKEDTMSLFTDEEKEDLDPRYIEMADRAVQNALNRANAKWEAKNDALLKALNEVKEVTHKTTVSSFRDRVLSKLGMDMNKFTEVDNSKEFNTFIQQPDGFSGRSIQDSLEEAMGAQDVDRVVRVYNTYRDSVKAGEPAAKKVKPQAEMPARVASTSQGLNTSNEVTMTHDEIARRYAKGELTPSEMKRLEALADAEIEKMYQQAV